MSGRRGYIVTSLAAAAPEALAWDAPSAGTAAAGQTSATITWATPTGGAGGYTYSTPTFIYDSQGSSTTASLSTSGAGAGTTTVSGLVNGQVVVVSRTVTDADGTTVPVQGVAAVAASAATLTLSSAPAAQSLAAGTSSATLGTWGAATGGTGPYTYAVTELSGGGTTISPASGLGPHTVTGLTDGQTYAYLMTATDALSARGYSVVTVSIAAGSGLGTWAVVAECDFTDSNWTALSSTNATALPTAWQHTLYEADGVTPRAYVFNNSTQDRTLSLAPSGVGLELVNGSTSVSPYVGVWPANWTALLGGSRRDAWMIEAVLECEEPAGSGAFAHVCGITPSTASTPGTSASLVGVRCINTGSNTRVNAVSYVTAFTEATFRDVATGATRLHRCSVQVTIADARRHNVYYYVGATDYQSPASGPVIQTQQASTTMSAVGGENTSSATWFGTAIGSGRTKWFLYHNGSATSGSAVRLKKLRLLRMPLGSL